MESIAAVLQEPTQVVGRYPAHDYTVTGLLASRVQALPNKDCLVFEGRTWTYSELARDVEHTADWFVEIGIRTGDWVGVFPTSHSSSVMLFLALPRKGGSMGPVKPEFGVAEASRWEDGGLGKRWDVTVKSGWSRKPK